MIYDEVNKILVNQKILVSDKTKKLYTSKTYYFLCFEYGIFKTRLSRAIKGRSHPNKKQEPTKWKFGLVKKELKKRGYYIVKNSYTKFSEKARIICKKWGEFYGVPEKIIYDNIGHPKGASSKRQTTMLKKYGVKYYSQTKEYNKKVRETYIKRYGVEHNMHLKSTQNKVARSSNNRKLVKHWKTGEQLICIGSYEYKVVNYLNKNKIDYLWQPSIFKTPFKTKTGRFSTYRPDLYLVKKGAWVEIKGYFRKDALDKWNWFKKEFPNSELWDSKYIKEYIDV